MEKKPSQLDPAHFQNQPKPLKRKKGRGEVLLNSRNCQVGSRNLSLPLPVARWGEMGFLLLKFGVAEAEHIPSFY
jgi:hypothetical protein